MDFQQIDQQGRGEWSATGAGTNAGVTVTHTLTTGAVRSVVTGIDSSGDPAADVTVESPASTVVYRKRFAAAFNMSEEFEGGIPGASGQNVLVKISASTSNCEANIQGFDEGSTT